MRAVVGPLLALVVAAALVTLAALAMFAPPPAPAQKAEGTTTRWSHGDPLVPIARVRDRRSRGFDRGTHPLNAGARASRPSGASRQPSKAAVLDARAATRALVFAARFARGRAERMRCSR